MPNPVLFIAFKELSSEKRKMAIIVLAIAAGVTSYLVMDSMFAGWGTDILDKTVDIWTSHMKILPSEEEAYVENAEGKIEMIENLPNVTGASARINFASFVKSKSEEKNMPKKRGKPRKNE